MSLSHLDRPFDYLVPAELSDQAVPGCRVRVRFSGRLVDGFVLARTDESTHEGKLSFLERVTSPEPLDQAVPGCRVRVLFPGRLVDGFVLARPDEPPHEGKPSSRERVPPPEP